ncbi:DUF3817 domain-containing protein [Streptomyces gamaensis]|uniref:DUF3817 domain-containing protein n=1 Tax=Streptomyces gamaensis TaxID=1763542 RepID=A0ABW0Z1P4_9ACTN
MKRSVLTRYRVMAYITGALLILLTLGMIAKYGLDMDIAGAVRIVAIAHGWLFVVYLVFAFDMASKAKWSFGRLVWTLVAGTIPLAAFFVERRATRDLEPLVAAEVPA